MKAIKIDAYANTITEVEISNDFREISRNIGCDLFCVGHTLPNGDTLFVDDEGWLNYNVTRAFGFSGRILAGNGLILGSNQEGDSISAKSSLDKIKNLTQFLPEGWNISDSDRDAAMSGWKITTMT